MTWNTFFDCISSFKYDREKEEKQEGIQAGAELSQAQVKLEVKVEAC